MLRVGMADEPGLHKLTAKELENWIPVVSAVQHLETVLDPFTAVTALLRRLTRGQLRSAAQSFASGRRKGSVIEIEPERWSLVDGDADIWRTGDLPLFLETEGQGGRRPFHVLTYYGVRFDPSGFAEMMAALGMKSPAAEGSDGPARPPAWWREAVLTELAGRLYEGALHPKRLADLEKAAHDWLAAQGEHPEGRTVRSVVQPLWERIQNKRKNSPERS